MKKVIKTIAAIIIVIASVNTTFGKTKKMTSNEFNLKYHQVDNSLVGTWEKNKTADSKAIDTYCQFNQNGTYLTYEYKKGKYTVTGRGNWMVKNNKITILSGNEVSSKVAYISTNNSLQFGNNIAYTKPASNYASK